jgi:hypothetical protein
MNDAWTHDLLMGPYGNMTKPNSVEVESAIVKDSVHATTWVVRVRCCPQGPMAIPDANLVSVPERERHHVRGR